jgi:hypothetical protein
MGEAKAGATTPTNAPASNLQAYLPIAEAQRGSSVDSVTFPQGSVAASSSVNGVTSVDTSTLVSDSKGTYTLSLDSIPQHSQLATLHVATASSLTTWVVDTTTQQVLHEHSGNFSDGPITSGAPVVASQSITGSRGSSTASPALTEICRLDVYEVDVIGGGFGPLLDGYEKLECPYTSVILLSGRMEQATIAGDWANIGTLQDDSTTAVELTLTVYNNCHASSLAWPFRLVGSDIFEFDGGYGGGTVYGPSKNDACNDL